MRRKDYSESNITSKRNKKKLSKNKINFFKRMYNNWRSEVFVREEKIIVKKFSNRPLFENYENK